jgi:hypothetical protein
VAAALGRDIRYAVRMLGARPAFTAVAVFTLALGIGANTAIFSVVRSLLLEPLPFHDPDRLVMLWEADAQNPQRTTILSMPNYADFSRSIAAFEATGIYEYLTFNLSGDGEAERVPGLRVSASTFPMLGVAPELGRTFTAEEDQARGARRDASRPGRRDRGRARRRVYRETARDAALQRDAGRSIRARGDRRRTRARRRGRFAGTKSQSDSRRPCNRPQGRVEPLVGAARERP